MPRHTNPGPYEVPSSTDLHKGLSMDDKLKLEREDNITKIHCDYEDMSVGSLEEECVYEEVGSPEEACIVKQ